MGVIELTAPRIGNVVIDVGFGQKEQRPQVGGHNRNGTAPTRSH